jgi:hypothetical protein
MTIAADPNSYFVGELVRISGEFRDLANALVDPTLVRFKYKNSQGGQITTLTYPVDAALIKDAVGQYHVDVSASVAGIWAYRWQGDGANQSAVEASFNVKTSQF